MIDEGVIIKTRNHTVDIMKFLAAILITNSHMGELYPGKFHILATGGSIGDALFFFCSGFLLMKGRAGVFLNWYKRRINRIFPTIFAVALISICVFGADPSLKDVLLRGGGWFVQAILLFYAIFWLIKRFFYDKLWVAYAIVMTVILVWFFFFWDKEVFLMARDTYLRWPCYFMVMLSGASIYKLESNKRINRKHLVYYLIVLTFLVFFYYGYQLLEGRFLPLRLFQIIELPVLMCIVYMLYMVCSDTNIVNVYLKYMYFPIYYISACCLEVYLSQSWCFGIGENLIKLFPLNVIATFAVIFLVAYVVKVVSNFLYQTFSVEEYNWRKMVVL